MALLALLLCAVTNVTELGKIFFCFQGLRAECRTLSTLASVAPDKAKSGSIATFTFENWNSFVSSNMLRNIS